MVSRMNLFMEWVPDGCGLASAGLQSPNILNFESSFRPLPHCALMQSLVFTQRITQNFR